MRYKMIAIDLDGTLLTDSKRITKKNIEVLRILNKNGIKIVIATGRRYSSAKNFARQLGIEDIIILANNGNIIRRFKDDALIKSNYMLKGLFHNLMDETREFEISPVVHVDKYKDHGFDIIGEYCNKECNYEGYISKADNAYKKMDCLKSIDNPNVLSVVYVGEKFRLEKIRNKIVEKFPNKFNIYLMEKLVGVSPILEIIDSNTSKWSGIYEYSKTLNLEKEEIVTFGDDLNDADMIKNSGLGVSMKNGAKEILELADRITKKDNNNSGVAYELENIFTL